MNISSMKQLKDFFSNKVLLLPLYQQHKAVSKSDLLVAQGIWNQISNIKVTKESVFSDDVWDYNRDEPTAARNIQGAKLRIEFDKHSHIPPFVVVELKSLFHYILLNPKEFKAGNKNKRNNFKLKPNTLIAQFEAGLRFFNHVFKLLEEEYGNEYVQSSYSEIREMPESFIRKAAKTFQYSYNSTIKKFFFYLTHPVTKDALGAVININFDDCEWLVVKDSKRRNSDEKRIFADDVFETVVLFSSGLIIEFLDLMQEQISDKLSLSHMDMDQAEYKRRKITKQIMNDYGVRRLNAKGYSVDEIETEFSIPRSYFKNNGKLKGNSELAATFRNDYGYYQKDILDYVNLVQYSCSFIVAQYTGMRPSELSNIKISSALVKEDEFTLVCSEVVKHRNNLALFDDKWLAIPIVLDAFKAAKLLSKITKNDFLLSNVETVPPGGVSSSMRNGKIQMNKLLGAIYDDETVKKIDFCQTMTRHTLAYQLYKADVGLPFISHQLKHFVDSVEKFTAIAGFSETTLEYGGIADRLITDSAKSKKTLRKKAEMEYARMTMDPDGTYIGPKAQEHKGRLKKYFQGYMEAGYTKEEILEALVNQGTAIINVGAGFCFGGKREDFDESIPCIGSLRCNPVRCSNAIVTKAHKVKWKEVYYSNKALIGKPGYEERQEDIMEILKEARAVLTKLGEDINE